MSKPNEETEKYYEMVAKKLDATLQGLSKIGTQGKISRAWMEYLHVLIAPEDVKYLMDLPIFPATIKAKKFAKMINISEEEGEHILDRLFKGDIVMRVGSTMRRYGLHLPFLIFDVPPLSFQEMPKEKAQKLAELSYKYLVEEEWYRNFEGSLTTPLTRVIPVQESLQPEQEILPTEKVEEIIKNARIVGIQKCACRARLDFLGIRKCKVPLESCISVNQGAQYFIDRGHARQISKEEALKLLKEFNQMGLVHTTENYGVGDHTLICNCCSCCCSLLGGITRWNNPRAVAKANFIAFVKSLEDCTHCETCVEKCNFHAISLSEEGPEINSEKCMGCGICVVNCPANILELKRYEREVIYKNIAELGFKVAKETNKEIKF